MATKKQLEAQLKKARAELARLKKSSAAQSQELKTAKTQVRRLQRENQYTTAELKRAKRDLAKLKKAGLYKGDVRKRPTDYAMRQLRKYDDVVKDLAKVVTVPTRNIAKGWNQVFKTKNRRVVIPARKGERFFYNKKSGEVFSISRMYGKKIKRIFPKHRVTADNVKNLPSGPNIRFAIPIGKPGHRERFLTFDDLAAFMGSYDRYTDWEKYVEIEEILNDDEGNEDE